MRTVTRICSDRDSGRVHALEAEQHPGVVFVLVHGNHRVVDGC
jgi:hypothetical protein